MRDVLPRPSRYGFWPYLLLVVLGLVVLLPNVGRFGFWDPFEPGYVQSAREMVAPDGSLFVPTFQGQTRLDRPVLACWAIAAGTAVLGQGEAGARVPGVLAAIVALLVVFYAVDRLRGRQAGLLSALVLLSTTQFAHLSRQAQADIYLLTAFGSGLLLLGLAWFDVAERRRAHAIGAYAAFALAILAKGPFLVGALGLGTLALYAVARFDASQFQNARGETLRLAGMAGPALIALPILAGLATYFGTSPDWWGRDPGRRQHAIILREEIADFLIRYRLIDLGLLLTLLGAVLALVAIFRRGSPRDIGERIWAGLVTALALSASVCWFLTEPHLRIRVALWILLVAAGMLAHASIRRFLLLPEIWPSAGPHLRPLLREALTGVAVIAAVAGPWHLYVLWNHGPEYVSQFVAYNHIEHFFNEIRDGGNATYYLRTIEFGYFPWSCLVPVALAYLIDWRDAEAWRRRGFELLMMAACAVTFVVLTLPMTKLTHYLAVIAIPLAVLIGLTLDRLLDEPERGLRRLAWIVTAMLYLLPITDLLREEGLRYLIGSFTENRAIPPDFETGRLIGLALGATFVLLLGSSLVRSRILTAALVASTLTFTSWCTWRLIPELTSRKTMKQMGEEFVSRAAPEDRLGLYSGAPDGAVLYTGSRVENLTTPAEFYRFMHPGKTTYAVVPKESLAQLNVGYPRNYPREQLHDLGYLHEEFVLISNRRPAEGG